MSSEKIDSCNEKSSCENESTIERHTIHYLPISVATDNLKILVVGGGKVALHKITAIAKTTAHITVVSPEIVPDLYKYCDHTVKREYEESDLHGVSLVYACTNNRDINEIICRDCRKRGLMVNVADKADSSDFISPAVFNKGVMTVAVSSQGKNIKKTLKWRDLFKKVVELSEDLL